MHGLPQDKRELSSVDWVVLSASQRSAFVQYLAEPRNH